MKKNAFTMAEVLLVAVISVLLMMGLVQIPKYQKIKGKVKVVSHGTFACSYNENGQPVTYFAGNNKEPLPPLDQWTVGSGDKACWTRFDQMARDLEIPTSAEMLTVNLYGGGGGGQHPSNEWTDTITETILTSDGAVFEAPETALYSVQLHGQNSGTTYVSKWYVKHSQASKPGVVMNPADHRQLCMAPSAPSGQNGLLAFTVKLQKGDKVELHKQAPFEYEPFYVNDRRDFKSIPAFADRKIVNHFMHPVQDAQNHNMNLAHPTDLSTLEDSLGFIKNLTIDSDFSNTATMITPCPAGDASDSSKRDAYVMSKTTNTLDPDDDAKYYKGKDGGATELVVKKASGSTCSLYGVTGAQSGKINCAFRPQNPDTTINPTGDYKKRIIYLCTARFDVDEEIASKSAKAFVYPGNSITFLPQCTADANGNYDIKDSKGNPITRDISGNITTNLLVTGAASINGGAQIKIYSEGSSLQFEPKAGCGGTPGQMTTTMLPFMPNKLGVRPIPTSDQIVVGKGGEPSQTAGGLTKFVNGTAQGGGVVAVCVAKDDKNEAHDGYAFPSLPIFTNITKSVGIGGYSGSNNSYNAIAALGIGSGGGGGAFKYNDNGTPPAYTGVTQVCQTPGAACAGWNTVNIGCKCGLASRGGHGAIVITW